MDTGKTLPLFTAEKYTYEGEGRIVAKITCGLCGQSFMLDARCNEHAFKRLSEEQRNALLFAAAERKHACPDESLRKDPAETNRIVNKYHEIERRKRRDGIVAPTNPYTGLLKKLASGGKA